MALNAADQSQDALQLGDEPLPWTRRFMRHDAGGAAVRRDIQGLRAVAVLLVVLYDARVPIHGGLVGVDVFFVISGFIITGTLMRELEETHTLSISGFYARRAKRLLPAVAAVLIAVVAMTLLFLPKARWVRVGKDAVFSAVGVQNWHLANAVTYTNQAQAASPLQHFWSLAVEEQFYLIWPALLLIVTLIPRWRLKRSHRGSERATYTSWLLAGMALVLVPSLAYSIYDTRHNPAAAYFVTGTRLWELAVGGGVAVVAHHLAKTPRLIAVVLTWVGIAMVIAAAFIIGVSTPFPGSWALLPTLGAATVLGFGVAAGSHGAGLVLGLRPLVWIGGLSYSLYLWHWPLLVVAAATWGKLSIAGGLIVIGVSGIFAWASLKWIENPLRLRDSFSARPALALQMGLFATTIGVIGGLGLQFAIGTPPAPVVPGATAATPSSHHHRAGKIGQHGAAVKTKKSGAASQSSTGPARSGSTPIQAPPPGSGAGVLSAKNPDGDVAGAPVNRQVSITPKPQQAAHDDFGSTCVLGQAGIKVRACVFGDKTSHVNVALVGDSHAAQWLEPLNAIARSRGWRLTLYAKQDCQWAVSFTPFRNGRPYPNCEHWGNAVSSRLRAAPPKLVIVTDANVGFGPDAKHYTPSVLKALQKAYIGRWKGAMKLGSKVAVLADTPRPGIDVPNCVLANPDAQIKCAFPRAAHLTDNGPLDRAAKTQHRVTYIDLSTAICPTASCAPVIGGVLVYRDDNHLTASYAGTLASRLAAQLPSITGGSA